MIRNLKLSAGWRIRNSQKAFTLVEVLIYSVILAIFIGAAFSFIASILGTTDTLLERSEVLANQDLVERKIYWILGRASGVTLPAENSSSTVLNVSGSDAAVYPASFSIASGTILLSLSGQSAVPLTNNRIQANQFLAERFSNSQSSSTVKISLDLNDVIFPYIRATTTIFYVFPTD